MYHSFKTSETLLGIETQLGKLTQNVMLDQGFKTSETLLGIETGTQETFRQIDASFKTSETLLGIETDYVWFNNALFALQNL